MKTLKTLLGLSIFLMAFQLNAQSHRWEDDDDYNHEYKDYNRGDHHREWCCDIDRSALKSLALLKRKINKTKRFMLRDGYLDRREVRTLDRMRFKLHRQTVKAHRQGCRFNRH